MKYLFSILLIGFFSLMICKASALPDSVISHYSNNTKTRIIETKKQIEELESNYTSHAGLLTKILFKDMKLTTDQWYNETSKNRTNCLEKSKNMLYKANTTANKKFHVYVEKILEKLENETKDITNLESNWSTEIKNLTSIEDNCWKNTDDNKKHDCLKSTSIDLWRSNYRYENKFKEKYESVIDYSNKVQSDLKLNLDNVYETNYDKKVEKVKEQFSVCLHENEHN